MNFDVWYKSFELYYDANKITNDVSKPALIVDYVNTGYRFVFKLYLNGPKECFFG